MTKRAKGWRFITMILLIVEVIRPSMALTAVANSDVPLIRGPAVNQEQFEAFAEAQGRNTLAESLDLNRPAQDQDSHLRHLIEHAQNAWLNSSLETARSIFKEIARQTLQADWREPQREAIHYGMLRLAQTAPTGTEKEEWIQKAIVAFPDLQPDADAFPPPLMTIFRSERARLLQLAHFYMPFSHFPDHRFLLINGKKFQLTPELKIRLPEGTYRVTALSDAFPPITEKLSVSQMEVFRLATPAIASGTCESPAPMEPLNEIPTIAVLFAPDCLRVHAKQGWLAHNSEYAENERSINEALKSPASFNLQNQMAKENGLSFEQSIETQSPLLSKKNWLWIGLSVVAASAAYVIIQQYNRNAAAPQETRLVPVHHDGF